jgi:hypothetical protein
MLTFDEANHVYFWCGKPVPNVTRVIGHLTDYSKIDPHVLRRAQEEGKAVHKMVELDCKGELDLKALHTDERQAWMRPRYEAWLKFLDETGFDCIVAEEKLFDPMLEVAGTPDLIGELPRIKRGAGIWNIDVKRSLYAGPAIGLQCAGYTEIYNRKVSRDSRVTKRAALTLRDDATYRLTTYEDPEDRVAFLACLQQFRWRQKHYGSA